MYQFKKAVSVWCESVESNYNQFVGFYTALDIKEPQLIKIAIAARSYYRLYINGVMKANGPARTAKNYCRIDEIKAEVSGNIQIAIEVIALNSPEHYSNDCTMEPGMLTVEITDSLGNVLSATGWGEWKCSELNYRRMVAETMSHCRGIVESYDLDVQSYKWRTKLREEMEEPIVVTNSAAYLERRAPYPSYREIKMGPLMLVSDRIEDVSKESEIVSDLAKTYNPIWYNMIPEENKFLDALLQERDAPFTGMMLRNSASVSITPGDNPVSLMWGINKSELGFIDFHVEVQKDCIIDIINSDHMNECGYLKANRYAARYCLKQGSYQLTTFEPKLVRYIKVILRTSGIVKLCTPQVLEYTYPDDNRCFFECNDGELNAIYEASRRTLRLNTLDIFMDCPERERGGWLCDSQFTAHGAWQMFGDLSVEKDFIENFMLTDPDIMWHSFFPEVYPGSKKDESDPGISNWSFWLMTELADYYERSGDKEFIMRCKERVSRFIEGVLELRGNSGLLEGLNNQFVDWSLSTRSFCLQPISIPVNCQAVYMLEKMAELYQQYDWKKIAAEMRKVIEKMDTSDDISDVSGDSAAYIDGQLKRLDCATESGIALELWSGFHLHDRKYVKRFIESMGTKPKYRSNPNIGRSNLFIGLMIRFDVLARLGKIDTLIKELKDVYLAEIKDGSGTLFENYAALSGCHGFNGAVGAMLTNQVLGLGQPLQSKKSIIISPHPGNLNWAFGSAQCEDGAIFMNWAADHEEHVLKMLLELPLNWNAEYKFPFELTGWTIYVNGSICEVS